MLFGRKSSPRASPLPLKKSDDPGPIKPKKKCTLKMLALGLVGIMFFRFFLTMAGRIVFSTFVFVASFDKSGSLDRFVNHAFYQILDGLDTQGELTCMNWGYVDLSPDAPKIEMDASDEPERWCLQMYNKIASAPGDLTGLNVLEVGSGRGGGSSYTKRYLHPAKMTGLDYSSKAVDFCQEKHAKNVPGLTYLQGNAEDLPFGNDEFDVVINVESSHCYGHFDKFLSEVYRVLKPGGQFSWVDIRKPDALPGVEKEFAKSGFTELKSEDVTKNVVAAMSKSGENRLKLIQRRVPKFAQPIFHSFAGVEGTQPYKELTNREVVYTHKLLKKASD